MSELKIRTIHDPEEEEITSIIGIDRFDDIQPLMIEDSGIEYYCACVALDSYCNAAKRPCVEFGAQTSFKHDVSEGIAVSPFDEFGLPNPLMYRILGEALKRRGMVFNKKKCRFQKVNS
jgi:hypothetical protein